MDLLALYHILHNAYGSQGWWPVADTGKSFSTYRKRARLSESQQWEIIFGAILTQSTSWKNVEHAIAELRKRGLLDPERIQKIPMRQLALCIRSAGYHNQKAKKLKSVAKFLTQHTLRNLRSMPREELRELLLAQYGIGPETADSIMLYALRKPTFVLDAYTRRIMARIQGRAMSDDQLRKEFMHALDTDAELFGEFHALFVAHAKAHCRKIPNCEQCPLQDQCRFAGDKFK